MSSDPKFDVWDFIFLAMILAGLFLYDIGKFSHK